MFLPDLFTRPTLADTDDYCVYLMTRETIILAAEDVELPQEGRDFCYVRRVEKILKPCQFPFSKETCHLRTYNDFCDQPWAKE